MPLVGSSPHRLCGGSVPQSWAGSGTSATSSSLCLQDKSLARPLDGDGDGVAACDIGAIEVERREDVFANGFEGVQFRATALEE